MPHPPGKIAVLLLLGLGGLAALAVSVLSLYGYERPFPVRLSSGDCVPHGGVTASFRFAVAPVLSPERTLDQYHKLTDYLASRLDMRVTLVQRKTYAELNELLRLGNVHAAIICTGAYLHARGSGVDLEVAAVPVLPQGTTYQSYLVVRSEQAIEGVNGLRGLRFAYSDPLSLSGHDWPILLLQERGLDPASFFSGTCFTYSHSGSLHAVLDGIADCAAVDSLVYNAELRANPRLEPRLRVLEKSPPLPIQPLVVAKQVAPEVRTALRGALLSMADSPEGQAALSVLGAVGFQAAPPDFYDALERQLAPIFSRRER